MLNAQEYLNGFNRWTQLTEQISDEQARDYVDKVSGFFLVSILKALTLGDFMHPKDLVSQQDLEGRAKLLHEKEEIFQLARLRDLSIPKIIAKGSYKVGIIDADIKEAHSTASRTELDFYRYVSVELGNPANFGKVLALASPFYQVRFLWSPKRVINFAISSGNNLLGVYNLEDISKDQIMQAMEIHEAFGSRYKFNAEQLYLAIHR